MNTCTDRDHTAKRHYRGMCEDAGFFETVSSLMAPPPHVYVGATVSAQFWGGIARIATVLSLPDTNGDVEISIGGRRMTVHVVSLYAV